MRVIGRAAVIMAAVALSLSLAAPATAAVTQPSKKTPPVGDGVTVVEASMEWNCEDLTEADRQKAIAEGVQMCGINEPAGALGINSVTDADGAISPLGSNTNNCGTALIYVDELGGKARVSYALHSTAGIITSRYLNVWWGPTYAGSKVDTGTWWGDTYSGSQTNIGYAMNGKQFGAGMNGVVTILGWTIGCDVYASEPTRKL